MLAALLTATATNAGDLQYWSTWGLSTSLTDRDHLAVRSTALFRDDMRDDYVHDEYLMYSRDVGGGVLLLGQFLFAAVETNRGQWAAVRCGIAGVAWQRDLPLLGRLRLEERILWRIPSPSGWDHHRPRLHLTRKLAGPVSLYLSNEPRLDLSGERPRAFYRNRLFATLMWSVTRRLTVGVGGVRQWDRAPDGGWNVVNALQTVVSLSF